MPVEKPVDPLTAQVLFQVRDGKKVIGSRQVPVKQVVDRLIHITQNAHKPIELMQTLRDGVTYKYKDKLGSKKVNICVKPLVGQDYGTGKPRVH